MQKIIKTAHDAKKKTIWRITTFVYIFPLNKKWREKCGTFFLFFIFTKKYFERNISLEKWKVETSL